MNARKVSRNDRRNEPVGDHHTSAGHSWQGHGTKRKRLQEFILKAFLQKEREKIKMFEGAFHVVGVVKPGSEVYQLPADMRIV